MTFPLKKLKVAFTTSSTCGDGDENGAVQARDFYMANTGH